MGSGMSKEDLSALVKQLYDQSCSVFGEKFHMEYAVKKRDMEIHNLEMETSESHGTFKIPKLKKVNKFKMMGDERRASRARDVAVHQSEYYLTCKQHTQFNVNLNMISL